MPTAAARLVAIWSRLSRVPGGHRLFGLMIRLAVPYSGSIGPRVLRLDPGHAVVEMRDRRRLRNHLRSVHALALANLGELASGLAMTLALPPGVRGIPVRIEVDYLKKARGRIRADGRAVPPTVIDAETDAEAFAEISDAGGDTVARMRVQWRLGPVQERR